MRHDDSAMSELLMILLAVIAIIVLIGLIAGGFTLLAALFLGGRFGAGIVFLVLAGIAYAMAVTLKLFAKSGMWGGHILAAIGILFIFLGVLGR
jgi:hypothetical protein